MEKGRDEKGKMRKFFRLTAHRFQRGRQSKPGILFNTCREGRDVCSGKGGANGERADVFKTEWLPEDIQQGKSQHQSEGQAKYGCLGWAWERVKHIHNPTDQMKSCIFEGQLSEARYSKPSICRAQLAFLAPSCAAWSSQQDFPAVCRTESSGKSPCRHQVFTASQEETPAEGAV